MTTIELQAHLADLFANPNIRDSVSQAFADNDPFCAALILSRLVERRMNRASPVITDDTLFDDEWKRLSKMRSAGL